MKSEKEAEGGPLPEGEKCNFHDIFNNRRERLAEYITSIYIFIFIAFLFFPFILSNIKHLKAFFLIVRWKLTIRFYLWCIPSQVHSQLQACLKYTLAVSIIPVRWEEEVDRFSVLVDKNFNFSKTLHDRLLHVQSERFVQYVWCVFLSLLLFSCRWELELDWLPTMFLLCLMWASEEQSVGSYSGQLANRRWRKPFKRLSNALLALSLALLSLENCCILGSFEVGRAEVRLEYPIHCIHLANIVIPLGYVLMPPL